MFNSLYKNALHRRKLDQQKRKKQIEFLSISDPTPRSEMRPFDEWRGKLILFANKLLTPGQVRSTLVLGNTGSGKSVTARMTLLTLALYAEAQKKKPRKEQRNVTVLYFDPKPVTTTFLQSHGLRPKVLHSGDKFGSTWPVGRDYDTPASLVSWCKHIVQERPHAGDGAFWDELARFFFYVVGRVLQESKPYEWDIRDFYSVSVASFSNVRKAFETVPEGRIFIEIIFREGNENDKTLLSLRQTILTKVAPLGLAAAHARYAKHKLSIREMLQTGGTYGIEIDQSEGEAALPLIHAFFDRWATLVMSGHVAGDDQLRSLVYIEELPVWGKLQQLAKLAAVGREYGAHLFLIAQSYDGIKKVYGEDTDPLLAVMPQKWAVQLGDATTKAKLAELSGEGIYLVREVSFGSSLSNQVRREKRFRISAKAFSDLKSPDKARGIEGIALSSIPELYDNPFQLISSSLIEAFTPKVIRQRQTQPLKGSEQVPIPFTDEEFDALLSGKKVRRSKLPKITPLMKPLYDEAQRIVDELFEVLIHESLYRGEALAIKKIKQILIKRYGKEAADLFR